MTGQCCVPVRCTRSQSLYPSRLHSFPLSEVATQEAIASTKQKELLAPKSDDFELPLLLTQAEALSYGWHLAKVACETDTNPERARAMATLRGDL